MGPLISQPMQDASGLSDRVNVLGVGINPLDMDQALDVIGRAIDGKGHHYVCCAAVHSLLDAQREPDLSPIFNRSLMTTPDGMPLVWLCRRAGHKRTARVYGPDLLERACASGRVAGWRHFFLGGSAETVEALTDRLTSSTPGLQVAGRLSPTYPDPMIPSVDSDSVDVIGRAKPDVVWVGLGTGKQERWMARHLGLVQAPLMIGVGAAFDLVAGTKRQAPMALQRAGLEWLFRWVMEPRRLWSRYARYPAFGWLLLLQRLGLRAFPLAGGKANEGDV